EEVDDRSDLYGLGAMMYECLWGLPPIRANNPHAMLARVQDGVSDPLGALPPNIDPAIVDVVNRVLIIDKEQALRTDSTIADAAPSIVTCDRVTCRKSRGGFPPSPPQDDRAGAPLNLRLETPSDPR